MKVWLSNLMMQVNFNELNMIPDSLKYAYEWKLCISAVNAINQLIEKAQALTNLVKTMYMCPEDLYCTAHLKIGGLMANMRKNGLES